MNIWYNSHVYVHGLGVDFQEKFLLMIQLIINF